jgi:Rps23 Pro-64 3,4-dihydroxylase Tpa1-like proline 4-hydroxylase
MAAILRAESAPDLTTQFSELFSGQIHLSKPIAELKHTYGNAKPFPYLVMDDLFSPALLGPLQSEITRLRNDKWLRIENESMQKVDRMRSGMDLGEAGIRLIHLLHSAGFLYLLSEITGVWQLLPDPYLQGAGYASMGRGDFFQIHSDRSVAYETGLRRRLAMIIFLNKAWSPEYRGELEMWDDEGKACCTSIAPLFNRTVLFEVADPNFHGVPTPLACPADRTRQSFMVYYHTAGNGENATVKPHTSLFAPGIYRRKRTALQSFVHDYAPPALLKAVKKFV